MDRKLPDALLARVIPDYRPMQDSGFRSDFSKVLREPWVDDFLVNDLNQMAYVFSSLNSVQEINQALRQAIRKHLEEEGFPLNESSPAPNPRPNG